MNASVVNASVVNEGLLKSGNPGEVAAQAELSALPTLSTVEGEPLRHILLGSPGAVRQTIHLLHTLRYVETTLWSPQVAVPDDQLIITPRPGDVISILIRHLR
ncbi:MAG: hypothetical protein WA885_21245 [Phormidesmis sp.]